MPRTTIDLDQAVLNELKALGVAEGRSLGAVASDLLATALKERAAERSAAAPGFAWRTADLGTPLVDLDDREAIRRVTHPAPS